MAAGASATPVASSGYTTALRNQMRQIYQSQLTTNFATTLNQVPDIVNILVAQAWRESSFNVNALGPPLANSSSIARDYLNSPVIVNFLKTANPTQRANVYVGIQALGLSQNLGLNSVRGASAKTGKCLVESARPDLAAQLCVDPGTDLKQFILGTDNIQKTLMLQLVTIEQKFKGVRQTTNGFIAAGDSYNRLFPSKISAAVAAYLGLGVSDSNGTTPQAYAASIVGGSAYSIANGANLKVAQHTTQVASNTGPSTNGSGQSLTIPGC